MNRFFIIFKNKVVLEAGMEQEVISLLAILFGILIIAVPAILSVLVGIFLIIFGVLTLLGRRKR
jgi:uncharacterized membrane protein HdeD (DUF308 family)